MVEKKIEENQGMMKEDVMNDGMKRGCSGRGTVLMRFWILGSTWEVIQTGVHGGSWIL